MAYTVEQDFISEEGLRNNTPKDFGGMTVEGYSLKGIRRTTPPPPRSSALVYQSDGRAKCASRRRKE